MIRHFSFAFWKSIRPRTPTTAGWCTAAHLLLIALAVAASHKSARLARETYEMRVAYLPPPDPEARSRRADATRETIRYVELAPAGEGGGFGVAQARADRAPVPPSGPEPGDTGKDSTTAPAEEASEGTDSVFTIVEVDSAAARIPESAAPQYPQVLLEKRLEGQAIVQFVVDTNGRADTASFKVMLASHDAFAQSVRAALPEMRFTTARIGRLKVRQLVELPFNFRLILPDTAPAPVARRRPGTPR